MELTTLGRSGLQVSRVCLGTMTFGEQVDEAQAHALLDHALERGVNFLDTAEMYSVPPRAESFGRTESILGNWFAARPGVRDRVVLATKVSGPSRGYDWIRNASPDLTPDNIVAACHDSLRRLRTDRIDLYQIHWPVRHVPMFGGVYFDPRRDLPVTSIHDQLEALGRLVRDGKVRAVGLSNETPYGVAEFVRLAEQHGLPRIASVQNPYSLLNRTHENGLDEVMYRLDVSLLAYSPLAFGSLTGKYDEAGLATPAAASGRLARYDTMKKQRWARLEALAAARRYNTLARDHGLTPTRMALAFCYTKWQVASTIIGVTDRRQLDEDLDAWGTTLSPELLAEIDRIRWELRDPAQ
ncbi:aldo/keto reductase [Caldimonas brevitalea]|uniref:Aldo/keto reductase n=1 Tax=Caldimonas brevitalea TaxID=413882 RepID=A0A0G3BMI6_9BURK|nr:aldo/keto reductase [Caldimonas brevitalea]AKJ30622.1 aldo/keto reductase [Caldimonas brevitalea]